MSPCSSLNFGSSVKLGDLLMISNSRLFSSSFEVSSMFSSTKSIAAAAVKKTDTHGLLVMQFRIRVYTDAKNTMKITRIRYLCMVLVLTRGVAQ